MSTGNLVDLAAARELRQLDAQLDEAEGHDRLENLRALSVAAARAGLGRRASKASRAWDVEHRARGCCA